MKLRLTLLFMCMFGTGLFADAQTKKTAKPQVQDGPDAIPIVVTSHKKSHVKKPFPPPKVQKTPPPPPPAYPRVKNKVPPPPPPAPKKTARQVKPPSASLEKTLRLENA